VLQGEFVMLTSPQHGIPAVMVIDAMTLRRAGLISVLAPWAASEKIELIPITPSEICEELKKEMDCKMTIFCFGGLSILRPENLQQVKVLHALAPDAHLVVLSDMAEPVEVVAAFNAGARGFVRTDLEPELATQVFSFILNGGSYFPPSAMGQLLGGFEHRGASTPAPSSHSGASGPQQGRHLPANDLPDGCPHKLHELKALTVRQKSVLEHICQGEPNKLIARRLGMKEGTVKVHVRQIMRKLGAANRTQVAVCAANSEQSSNGSSRQLSELPVSTAL
jgi:DNA-binding NarL/FixJ family response regulator